MGFTAEDYTGPTEFVHLHNHTVFSALDGVSSPEQYAEECGKRGYPAMAATEHGHMASVPDMYFAFKKHGVQYIPGCFLPTQKVYTTNGVKELCQITINDRALTHLNNRRRIDNVQIRPYFGELVRLKAWCVEDQLATPEHPFLVREVVRWEKSKGVWDEEIKVDWVKAGDLYREKYCRTYATKRSEDRSNKRRYRFYLCVPRMMGNGIKDLPLSDYIFSELSESTPLFEDQTIVSVEYRRKGYRTTKPVNLPTRLELSQELLWIMGLWLAEGSADASLEFSLSIDEYDFYQRIADYFADFGINTNARPRNGNTESQPRDALDVTVYSSYFSRLFAGLFNKGFANKRIPDWFLKELSSEQAHCLLEGLLDGDAKRLSTSSYLKLNNETLIWQSRILMTKLDTPQYSTITELPCNNSSNLSYSIRKRESGCFYYDYDDEFIYLPIYDVSREQYRGDVYNLQVDQDSSYNTGVAVHNCEIYFNDYEPLRKQFVEEGVKLKTLAEEDYRLSKRIRSSRHVTALCKNETGFHNLIKLTTLAHEFGFYYNPRVWFDKLCEFKEGLIILSGCLNGPVSNEVRLDCDAIAETGEKSPRVEGRDHTAVEYIQMFQKEFGDDFLLELQMPCLPELHDHVVFAMLVRWGAKYGVKIVLTNDAHYMTRDDFMVQKVMMAISQGKQIYDPELFQSNSDEQFMKTRAELWETFKNGEYSKCVSDAKFEEMCDNTLLVAKRCEPLNPDTNPKIPDWSQVEPGADAGLKLREAVAKELVKRGLHKVTKKYVIDGREVSYVEQSKIELGRFIDKGFASYFLITQDLLQYGHRQGWPFGPRGCTLPSSQINTIDGQKAIQDIRIGDAVLDGFGYERTVENKFAYDVCEQLIKIGAGDMVLTITEDHKLYIIRDGVVLLVKACELKDTDELIDACSVQRNNCEDQIC